MKKFVAFLLIGILMVSISACDLSDLETPTISSPTIDIPAIDPNQDVANNTESLAPEVTDNIAQEITFEEIVVVDNEQCAIKITDIDKDNMWGYTLKVYLENKSADKTFMFSVVSASVNGVDSDPLFAQEVAAGKKSNASISFMDSALEDYNIGEFTDILLNFRVYDSDDWFADDIATTSVHVYPYGEDNATKYVREQQPTDTVLVDNEYASVIVTDYDPDNLWGYTANIYIVNKTDTTIMVSVDDASVNGYMLDPFFATSVIPGACKFSSISWSSSDFEENNITEVENIEFNLRIYNENDWMAEDFANDTIALTP